MKIVVTKNDKQLRVVKNELSHAGIKGMKWGQRRYQNEDGTLTPAGKKRYNKGSDTNDAKKKVPMGMDQYTKDDGTLNAAGKLRYTKNTKHDVEKKGMNPYTLTEFGAAERKAQATALKEAGKMVDQTSKIGAVKGTKQKRKDYSKLSDTELRDKVNRLNLEEQYGRLSGDTKYVRSGSEWVREALQTTGAILGIAGSAVAIYVTLNSNPKPKKR